MNRICSLILAAQVALIATEGEITEIRLRGNANPIWERTYKFVKSGVQEIPLELEQIPDQISIEIPGKASITSNMVEWRYESSLTIANEGPHLDLVDWRHYVSEWAEAKLQGRNQYTFDLPQNSGSLPFPNVSMAAVRTEVAKYDPVWAKLISNAKSIREFPLSVGLSKISIRISERRSAKWVVIQTFHLLIPMGC